MKAKQLLHDLRSAIDNCTLHSDDRELLEPILQRIDAFFEPVSADKRIMNVCKEFDIGRNKLTGRSRKRKLVYIRAALAELLFHNGITIKQIAEILNRDRSTILYYFSVLENHYLSDAYLAEIFDRVSDAFYGTTRK